MHLMIKKISKNIKKKFIRKTAFRKIKQFFNFKKYNKYNKHDEKIYNINIDNKFR